MSIVTDVREMIGEATAAFFTDQQVYDAVNDAQLDMTMRSKWRIGTATLTVTTNQEFATIPTSIMIPQYLTLNNRRWFPTTQARLEQWDAEWATEPPAQPQWFVLWDAFNFRMWPKANATYVYDVVGPSYPSTEVTTGTTEIAVPDLLKRAVAHRAAAIILEYTQPQLADVYNSEADELEQSWNTELRNSQSHNIRRLRPGDRTTNAAAGHIESGRKFPWYWRIG